MRYSIYNSQIVVAKFFLPSSNVFISMVDLFHFGRQRDLRLGTAGFFEPLRKFSMKKNITFVMLFLWWCLFEKVRTHFAENPNE